MAGMSLSEIHSQGYKYPESNGPSIGLSDVHQKEPGFLDKARQLWFVKLAEDLARAAMAPGNAYKSTRDNPVTTEQMIKPAADLAGVVMGGSYAAAPAMKNASGMGIKAYHGSPHDFDKFDLSKIGTGEGAQAYGHGLYFAEQEATAKAYRDTLQGKGFKIPQDVIALPQDQQRAILQAANAHGAQPDPMEAAKRAQWASADLRSVPIESIADKIVRSRPPAGRMYEVDINADPAKFLDWDKPLSAQGPEVQDAFKQIPQAPDIPGQLAYYRMSGGKLQSPEASAALKERGIPGIKYLDQGSRVPGFTNKTKPQIEANLAILRDDLARVTKTGGGDPARIQQRIASLENELRFADRELTNNYVVFDDSLISILKKYGIVVPGAGAALSTQED